MDKIYVVFWTQGGNTQAMAEAIGEGIREAGKEAEVVFVTGANLVSFSFINKSIIYTHMTNINSHAIRVQYFFIHFSIPSTCIFT